MADDDPSTTLPGASHAPTALDPRERWAVVHGNISARWAFTSDTDWKEFYDSVHAALLEELDQPEVSFSGFWLHEPGSS